MSEQTQSPTRVRYLIVLLATVMSFLLYLDRFCVGFAADYIRQDLGLSNRQMDWFLSAFFWSYALAQVPSGWLSDRYGARLVLGLYILTWSIFTALIGAANSFAMLIITRLGCGLGQAGAYPTAGAVVARWIPSGGRSFASSCVGNGGRIGGALAPFLTAWLMIQFVPMGTPVDLTPEAILDPGGAIKVLSDEDGTARRVRAVMTTDESRTLTEWTRQLDQEPLNAAAQQERRTLLAEVLSRALDEPQLYDDQRMQNIKLPTEATLLLEDQKDGRSLSGPETQRLNRFILEGVFPTQVQKLYGRGWRPILVLYGLAGIPVSLLFWLLFRDHPDQHHWANETERSLIRDGAPRKPAISGKSIGAAPVGQMLRSANLWHCSVMQFGTNIGWLFIMTHLPRYLLDVHQVPLLERGFMTMIPTLIGIGGMALGGWLCDALSHRYGRKWGRRLPILATRITGVSAYLLCIGLSLLAPDHPLNTPWVFVGLFTLVALSTDAGAPATWAFAQDVGGRHVGSVLGWGNMWGNIGAAVAPPLYGLALGEKPELKHWMLTFLICGGAFGLSTLSAFLIDATKPVVHDDADHSGSGSAQS